MGWRNRPTFIDDFPPNIDYAVFIDENGYASMSTIKKASDKGNIEIASNERFFTVTACVISRKSFADLKESIIDLKNEYWRNGLFTYGDVEKRVCFHSNEIRGRKGPFSSRVIDYDKFIADLSAFIEKSDIQIFSSSIDKLKHFNKYRSPQHPYSLCMDFVLERIVKFYLSNENCIVMLESRGKKEDKELLEHIKNIYDYGTDYTDSLTMKKIKGVYFNPKWCKRAYEKQSYFGLELADLVSYPLFKYFAYGKTDKAFEIIYKKIHGYPNIKGRGFKTFP